jgi:hypothetical protein
MSERCGDGDCVPPNLVMAAITAVSEFVPLSIVMV